jgi:hypothetical protein
MTDLAELEKSASPAPWVVGPGTVAWFIRERSDDGPQVGNALLQEDADLIAATRNALPYLLAVVEAAWVETDAHSARCRCIVEIRRALDALDAHLRGEK